MPAGFVGRLFAAPDPVFARTMQVRRTIPAARAARDVKPRYYLTGMLFAAIAGTAAPQPPPEISDFASVRDDGALEIGGYLVRLYGIYVPPTDQTCYTFIRPIPCGTRAALALDFKISGYFVHCRPTAGNPDGSISAFCTLDGEDLSAWMLQQGWAVALPDAPFQYTAMERIAQSKGIGIWGIPVDTRRPRR